MTKLSWSLLISAFFLLIPALGMFLSNEVNWQIMDFILAFILLSSLIFFIQWLYAKIPKPFRIYIIALVILLFLILWAELAVGILGTPLAND